MKIIMLLTLVATCLLTSCASYTRRNEIAVEVPSHDEVVRDEIPAEGGRKIPVIRKY